MVDFSFIVSLYVSDLLNVTISTVPTNSLGGASTVRVRVLYLLVLVRVVSYLSDRYPYCCCNYG